MESDNGVNVGYLEFCSKYGKTPAKYNLKVGSNKIGASLSSDIRIKSKSSVSEPVLCVINVQDNGLATLENACKNAVFINGSKITKIQVLKNKDKIDVAGKIFLYVNANRVPREVADSIKTEKRYSVMPSFKVKTHSKIPVSTNKSKLRSNLSSIETKKEMSRRLCMSALPNKRSRLSPWQAIATPNGRRSLRPSTSMQSNDDLSVTVRKALFLKNKADISFTDPNNESKSAQSVTSFVSLHDSLLTTEFEEREKSRRGTKRRRDSSTDSAFNVNKRRKHSKDQLVFLSISGCESLFEDTCSSLNSSVQDSPLATALYKMLNSQEQLNDLSDVGGVKKLLKSPKIKKSANDLSDVIGVKKTPRIQKSPRNDLTDVKGIKKLLKTPKVQKSPSNDLTDVRGVKKILKTPTVQKSPINDLTNVRGLKKMFKTPKVQKSPFNDLTQVQGVKKLMNTPKQQKSPLNDLTNVKGVKKIMRTPKVQKSPHNDLTDIKGVKKMFSTRHQQRSPVNDLRDVRGVKKLLGTPKERKSPVNDLSDVKGVKKMFRTPKNQKSPKNDLRNVSGIKKLMKTPKVPKSPLNDLTNVSEVYTLFQSPNVQKSPLNELTNVRKTKSVLKTPKMQKSSLKDFSNVNSVSRVVKARKHQKSPKNDLTNVVGVKRILRTPRVQKSPRNSLSDLKGVKELLKSPKVQKSPKNDLSDLKGVKELMTADQTLNNTLEEVFQEFLNDPDVHNSTQKLDSTKMQNDAPTPNLERNSLEQFTTPDLRKSNDGQIQVSQRGRRIRLKRFDDDFVGSPMKSKLVLVEAEASQKRSTRSRRQQKTVDQQISTNNGDAETPNLKKEKDDEMPMLKRNVRGRKKSTAEKVDTPSETKRGRNKKVAVDEQLDGTPQVEKITKNEEIPVPKRGGRGGRKKNVVEEVKESSTEVASPNVIEQEVKTRGRGRKKNVDEETTHEIQLENSTLEESDKEIIKTPLQKRSTRGRKKVELIEENDKIVSEKPTTRGRKRKNVVEDAIEESTVATPDVRSVQIEENNVPQKRQARGRPRKNTVVDKMEAATPELPKTRTRKKMIEDNVEVPIEHKKTRGSKRKNLEENANLNESSENGKKTKVINNIEAIEDTKVDEISPMKTRRGRKVNVQTEVEVKPLRRRAKK